MSAKNADLKQRFLSLKFEVSVEYDYDDPGPGSLRDALEAQWLKVLAAALHQKRVPGITVKVTASG